jgi:DNA-binding MarR family transcriptional regulator
MARHDDERVCDASAPQATADRDALDGFIAGYLPYLLAHASHLISGQFHEHLAARKVPVMQWRVMAALWDAPKSASEVAAVILQKQPTVSKLLERMRQQGLVDRSPDETDRRRVVISLTPRGRRVAGPLIEAAREHESAVLKPFGARNATTLVGILQALIDKHR